MLGSCGLTGRVVTRLPWWLCASETQVEVARPHKEGSVSPLPHSPAGAVEVLSLTGHTGPQAQLSTNRSEGGMSFVDWLGVVVWPCPTVELGAGRTPPT